MTARSGVVLGLAMAVLVSAVLVVQAKHEARELRHELRVLSVEGDRLNTEWAQLQLEESAWANPDRLARIVRERLNMQQPRDYVLLRDPP